MANEDLYSIDISSKFAICGLPIRMDTYKYCTFGCKYCFANNREIMKFEQNIQVANLKWLERKLAKVFEKKDVNPVDFLEVLIRNGIDFHCGGMSDPFQPCEKSLGITKQAVDICNQYERHILFSTKSDTVYDADIRPDLHTFQLSVTGSGKEIEPGVADIERRINFYHQLKRDGFRVGIRIQPFIPGVTTLDILETFRDADNITIEGIKIVPQNKKVKSIVFNDMGLSPEDFVQMGLLNLKPEIRLSLYKPFIEYMEANGIPYSIADNDLHYMGTNRCCCGDRLVHQSSSFNNTAMIKKYGVGYTKEQIDDELFHSDCTWCKCKQLFTSNRQDGCVSVQDFYDVRFYRKTSPFSPLFLYRAKEGV